MNPRPMPVPCLMQLISHKKIVLLYWLLVKVYYFNIGKYLKMSNRCSKLSDHSE